MEYIPIRVSDIIRQVNGERGFLARYFQPLLTDEERGIADLEGWILGIA